MVLLMLLPLISFLILVCICFSNIPTIGIYSKIRLALLKSFLFTGLFVSVSTEVLSYGQHITFKWFVGAWIVFNVLLIAYGIHRKTTYKPIVYLFKYTGIFLWKNPVLFVIPIILIVSTVIAIIYPPNNYDSLTYHMARVEHWINNRSVNHYETHIVRQLLMPPLGEWFILHAQLLSGTDRLANFIQTVFLGGCILQVSLIVKSLGGGVRMQVLGCLFSALTPMAIIQSNTTQNDIIVAYFVLAFVYYTVEIAKAGGKGNILLAGVSLGLAMLTKGTAYLFCALFCGWYLLLLFVQYREPFRKIVTTALRYSLVLIIALALNYAHFSRNIFFSGSITGDASKWVSNEEHNAKSLALVGIKNIMNHMPVTPSIKKKLASFAFNHGLDIDDPKYNYNTMAWMMEGFSYHEDYAQNFLHTILIAIGLLIFFFRPRLYAQKPDIWMLYLLSCIIICLLFTILFRWQPWSNRLQTGLFMLFCPLLAWTVDKMKPVFQPIIILPFMVFAYHALTKSSRHPILPVEESIVKKTYETFIYNEGLIECRKFLDTCSSESFGIYIGADSPDYVYYKMMAESERGRRPMIHMFADNDSRMYLNNLMPETIISAEVNRDKYTWRGRTYLKTKVFDDGPAIFTLQ